MRDIYIWEVHILPWLGLHEVLAVRATSTVLRDVIDESDVWKRMYREELGIWLDYEPAEARRMFFRRAKAQLIMGKYPGDDLPCICYFDLGGYSYTERVIMWLGRLAGRANNPESEHPFPSVNVKDMALSITECAVLSFAGTVYVIDNEGQQYRFVCPNKGRFNKLGSTTNTIAAIDDLGALYIYRRGHLFKAFNNVTYYAVKSCPWLSKLVCDTSGGLVAIETESSRLVLTRPWVGDVIDYALLYRGMLWVVYSTGDELHLVDLRYTPAKVSMTLGSAFELTGSHARIVRIEADPSGPLLWVINSEGQCFKGVLDFDREEPAVSFERWELREKVYDLSIGAYEGDRYAISVHGRPFDSYIGIVFHFMPTFKIATRFTSMFALHLGPDERQFVDDD